MKSERYGIQSRYVNSIQCPVDLDSIVMSSSCTPEYIEENLGVGQDILWDAIRLSTCQSWLLKLDVMERFTSEFRKRIYSCLPAFSRMNKQYFRIKLETVGGNLLDELNSWDNYVGAPSGELSLLNPMNMLSNDLKDYDRQIMSGKMELRNFILERIQQFLKTSDKDKVDFSCSLFLPDILNPKFFDGLSEAEHIVILGNIDKYFMFVEKFNKTGLRGRGSYQPGHELNAPQNLLKHVLSEQGNFTRRVKMIAWKQLYKEVDRLMGIGNPTPSPPCFTKLFDSDILDNRFKPILEHLERDGYTFKTVIEWLDNADGVFESFELDCTLHNLLAVDFFFVILSTRAYYKMAPGLIDFQDDETRDKLFNSISEAMVSFR